MCIIITSKILPILLFCNKKKKKHRRFILYISTISTYVYRSTPVSSYNRIELETVVVGRRQACTVCNTLFYFKKKCIYYERTTRNYKICIVYYSLVIYTIIWSHPFFALRRATIFQPIFVSGIAFFTIFYYYFCIYFYMIFHAD